MPHRSPSAAYEEKLGRNVLLVCLSFLTAFLAFGFVLASGLSEATDLLAALAFYLN